jgi:D-glycero-D-manno-heptose 1,7-bisphosphate phosphatase
MSHNLIISKPRQAVILAGGRGSRLRPLTDTMPKPMVPFHGKPFLQYLIEHLKEQGFERVLLLLGYLPQVIIDHFGDGSSFGLHVEYSVTNVEDETGRRLRLAGDKMDPCFLLMYSDNYWPMRIDSMWDQFTKSNTDMQITVYSNKDGYSRSNVRIENGLVELYDGARVHDNLQGVEIGFAFMKKSVLDLLPDGNVNFEKVVYPMLSEKRQLSAYVTDHRYYSVGSHERLELTDSFLKRRPAILLDRDGVLNKKATKAEYVRNCDEFRWLPGAMEAIRLLKDAGYIIAIVTNQAGIARGMMTELDLSSIHAMMKDDLAKNGATVDAIYYCPHGWDDNCECRKPKPGMLFLAQKEFHLDLSRVYFVGDDVRDEETALRAGSEFLMVDDNNSLLNLVKERVLKC